MCARVCLLTAYYLVIIEKYLQSYPATQTHCQSDQITVCLFAVYNGNKAIAVRASVIHNVTLSCECDSSWKCLL